MIITKIVLTLIEVMTTIIVFIGTVIAVVITTTVIIIIVTLIIIVVVVVVAVVANVFIFMGMILIHFMYRLNIYLKMISSSYYKLVYYFSFYFLTPNHRHPGHQYHSLLLVYL